MDRRGFLTRVVGAGVTATAAGYMSQISGPLTASAARKKPQGRDLQRVLSEFGLYAEQARRQWQTPGMSVGVVVGDRLVYAKGFGVKQLGGSDPVNERTVFQIGSISKSFTAGLVATLVDQGKIKWTDRVVDHLPDFQMYDPWVGHEFMVVDLMAQRSGLPPHCADWQSAMGFSRRNIIRSLRHLRPATSFRAQFGYQNNLFLVAAALVEKYSGQSWEQNLSRLIFGPLGMKSSSASLKAFRAAGNASSLHMKDKGRIIVLDRKWPFHHWCYVYGPAGGINSNVIDMANWLRLNMARGKIGSRRLFSAKNMDFVHSPQTVINVPELHSYYCQAWVRTEYRPRAMVWHNGETSGAKNILAFVPGEDIGVVILTNLKGTQLPEALTKRLFDLYFGNPRRDWNREALAKAEKQAKAIKAPQRPNPAAPPMAPSAYTGLYQNPVYGQVRVSAGPGVSLKAQVGPQKVQFWLHPWHRDTFLMEFHWPLGDQPAPFVRFEAGPSGKVKSMIIDSMDEAGAFTRVS